MAARQGAHRQAARTPASTARSAGGFVAIALVAILAVPLSAGADSPHPLKAWCQLKPGASRATIVKALGQQNPTAEQKKGNGLWAKYGGAPLKTMMWNLDGDILLVTFGPSWSKSTNLQAYYAPLAPEPAKNLTCHAFRNVDGVSSN